MLKFIILFPLKCLWAGFKLSMIILLGIVLAGVVITFFPFVATTGGLIGIVIFVIWWLENKAPAEIDKAIEEIKKEDEGK